MLTKIEPEIYDNLLRSHYGYLAGLIEKATDEYQEVNGPLNI